MKKEEVFCCVCCNRFKERRHSYEQYEEILKKIKQNKAKIILITCEDCKQFDEVFAVRDFIQKQKINKK